MIYEWRQLAVYGEDSCYASDCENEAEYRATIGFCGVEFELLACALCAAMTGAPLVDCEGPRVREEAVRRGR